MTRGFTLIELVVVVAIMAIVAAIAVPARSGAVRDYRVRLFESRLSADLAAAQRTSWHRSTQTALVFAVASNEYAIERTAARAVQSTVALGDSPYRLILSAVDFGDGVDAATFADGTPRTGALGKVWFSVSGQPFAARIDSAAATVQAVPQ